MVQKVRIANCDIQCILCYKINTKLILFVGWIYLIFVFFYSLSDSFIKDLENWQKLGDMRGNFLLFVVLRWTWQDCNVNNTWSYSHWNRIPDQTNWHYCCNFFSLRFPYFFINMTSDTSLEIREKKKKKCKWKNLLINSCTILINRMFFI